MPDLRSLTVRRLGLSTAVLLTLAAGACADGGPVGPPDQQATPDPHARIPQPRYTEGGTGGTIGPPAK